MIIIGFEEKNGDQLMVEVIFMGGIWGPYNFGYIYIYPLIQWLELPPSQWGITTSSHGNPAELVYKIPIINIFKYQYMFKIPRLKYTNINDVF